MTRPVFLLRSIRRLTEAAPGGIVGLWGATLILLAGGYGLAARRFRRVEAPLEVSAR